MKILVTGASGYLGGALLPRLSALGHEATPASRSSGVDLLDPVAAGAFLRPWRWDAVVHLAGAAAKTELDWEASATIIRSHVNSLLQVLAAIPAGWPGRFVHASGAIVYGLPDSLPVSEEHPRRPLHAYALAKCLAEDVLLASSLGDRWLLRMGGLFSQRRKSGALFHFCRAARHGEALRVHVPTPPVPWEILHVDDAVESIARALAAKVTDPCALNVGYGERVQIAEIATRVASRASGNARVVVEGGVAPPFQADITKARALLAWPPCSLDDRLDEMWSAAG